MSYNANKQCPLYDEFVGAEDCKYFNDCLKHYQKTGKIVLTTHHLWWPKNLYTSPLEKDFRNLPDSKEKLCARMHDIKHQEEPPQKPDREFMIAAIKRTIENKSERHSVSVQTMIKSLAYEKA